jgi:hypothetical protein
LVAVPYIVRSAGLVVLSFSKHFDVETEQLAGRNRIRFLCKS